MIAFFRYGISSLLFIFTLISQPLLADLVEFGYLVKPSDFERLSQNDQKDLYNAMVLDISHIPKAKTSFPEKLRDPQFLLSDPMMNYKIFRKFCLNEINDPHIHPLVTICNNSFELSHELQNKIFVQKYYSDSTGGFVDPPFHELVEQAHPNSPRIWDYATYFQYLPKDGVGWKSIEGYVCTSDDPLLLREGPGAEYPIQLPMPPRSSVILHNYRPYEDWTFVQYGEQSGYAHSSYLCVGSTREPVFTDEEENKDFSMDNFNFYISAKKSKCNFKDFPKNYIGPAGGNRKLWLNMCNGASGTTSRWCMDMTCPNIIPSAKQAFKKLYGKNVPFQLIPDSEQFGTGIELVRIVTKFEKAGLCIDRINNWHRPKKYNAKVGGKSASYHMKEGGAKAIDILFCNFKDQKKAAKLINKWNDGWFLGGVGVYVNSPTLHIDLRGYAARW